MKNLYKSIVLSIALVAPIVSEAATFNLGVFPGTINFGNTTAASAGANALPLSGAFSDTWNFTVSPPGASSTAGSVVNISNAAVANMSNVSAKLDGISFDVVSSGISNFLTLQLSTLSAGAHSLLIAGNIVTIPSGSSYGGTLNIDPLKDGPVGAVPVPAAVWLFGSALVGLMGVSGRKKKSLS